MGFMEFLLGLFQRQDETKQIEQESETIDNLKGEITLLNSQKAKCFKEKENFRQRINVLEDKVDDLKYNITSMELNELKTDLSQFKTNKLYRPRIGAKSFKLSTWLNNNKELEIVTNWINDNLDISELNGTIDEQALQLRQLIYHHFGSKDIWEADKVQNTFAKPSELIANDFKGNCNDWFTFIYYVYEAVFGDENKLYAVMGGLCLEEGWNQGNHAYCLWEHSDGKFYVVESAVGTKRPWSRYIWKSIEDFGNVDHKHNFRYSKIIWMANNKQTYHKVIF